jgi:hypothetical protein
VAPPHLLIRSIACVEGAVDVAVCYAPRPEYGLPRPVLSHVDGLFEKSRRGDRAYGPSTGKARSRSGRDHVRPARRDHQAPIPSLEEQAQKAWAEDAP